MNELNNLNIIIDRINSLENKIKSKSLYTCERIKNGVRCYKLASKNAGIKLYVMNAPKSL
jgi:hypothetical protein